MREEIDREFLILCNIKKELFYQQIKARLVYPFNEDNIEVSVDGTIYIYREYRNNPIGHDIVSYYEWLIVEDSEMYRVLSSYARRFLYTLDSETVLRYSHYIPSKFKDILDLLLTHPNRMKCREVINEFYFFIMDNFNQYIEDSDNEIDRIEAFGVVEEIQVEHNNKIFYLYDLEE